jgi:nitroimidazol reductase NimA-like FMN-containing flavoprotein (pyridoxamine 5'-phosphate oxidase superfamily)
MSSSFHPELRRTARFLPRAVVGPRTPGPHRAGHPQIFPVNFVVDDRTIVFRTGHGSKLRGLTALPSVCFEVDEIDLTTATGASVLVMGRAHELDTAEERVSASELPLELWTYGEKSHRIRIEPTEMTGRRINRPGSAHQR